MNFEKEIENVLNSSPKSYTNIFLYNFFLLKIVLLVNSEEPNPETSLKIDKLSSEFGNLEEIEAAWAVKSWKQAEIYFNLLCNYDCKNLSLTK
jgi:hypothetical protein